jgi:signal transduction histidine kinase
MPFLGYNAPMTKRKQDRLKQEYRLVLGEFEDNPYHRFNVVFAVMVLLPLLTLVYILASELFTLDIFAGRIGLILLITILIALGGYLLGYRMIREIINRVVFYALRSKIADEAKSTLIASLCHEFKNPIYTLKWQLFSLKDSLGPLADTVGHDSFDACTRTVERMDRLVADMLDIYKMEAGMVLPERKRCDIRNILQNRLQELTPRITQKNLTIINDFGDKPVFAWLDEDKISRVLSNILDNALKYTPKNGVIYIKLIRKDEFIRLEFQDTGKGIPTDKLDVIFDKFQRLDKTQDGLGLGLAISRDIVELHKGRIWAESVPGRGSKFIVLLPCDLRG